MQRAIGYHMRITESIEDSLLQAKKAEVTCGQFLFIKQRERRFYALTEQEIVSVRNAVTQFAGPLFVHANFWINLADVSRVAHPLFDKELRQAEAIGISRVVLHPGCIKGTDTRKEGITHIITILRMLLQKHGNMHFMLENVAYAGMNVGGDLHDLSLIAHAFSEEKRVGFCIDTGHAYAWGYDISKPESCMDFIEKVEEVLGWHRVGLLHLNDTKEACGSGKDVHCVPGKGLIGWDALIQFASHTLVKKVPIIVEMPRTAVTQQEAVISRLHAELC